MTTADSKPLISENQSVELTQYLAAGSTDSSTPQL